MKLAAVRTSKPIPLAAPYRRIAYRTPAHSPVAFGLTCPSTWAAQVPADGREMEVAALDGSAFVDITVATTAQADTPILSLMRPFGKPLAGIVNRSKSTPDGSLRTGDALGAETLSLGESQMEVRILRTGSHALIEVGFVAFSFPGMQSPTRPGNAAQQFEQVQATLNSIHLLR